MSKVLKGVGISAAIIFSGGAAAALIGPAGLGLLGSVSGMLTVVNSLAAGAFLSGVSAQLAKSQRVRPSLEGEYAGTVMPRVILYGKNRVSGMDCLPFLTYGTENKYLGQVLALAGHEVNAISAVYFDNVAVGTIGSISGTTSDGLVSTGDFANKAWIRRYLGTSSQTADYILNTALTEWTSDHRGRGVAYVALQYEYDEEVYGNGKPGVTFDVEGKKCYDPRLDTSPGANPTNASYIAYTRNPALCLADYLIDDDLGLGEDPTRIDWDMVADAADICDELVDVPTASTQERYRCDMSLVATTRYEDNMTALAACMLGSCLYSGGKWRIRAGAWETPSFEITDSNVMGEMDILTAYPYKDRYNGVRGTFIDPNNNYQVNEFPAVSDATYVSDDGESVFKDIELPGCSNVYEAQRAAILQTRRSRNRIAVTVACDMSLWKVRPGDTGIATISELGWVAKTFRCEAWGFSQEGAVALTLREESADDWDDPVEGDYLTPLAISTPTAAKFTPAAPSGLTATGVPRAINFTWTAPALVPTGAQYVLYEYTSSTPFSSATEVWRGRATNCRVDKSDVTERYYWVRLEMPDGTAGAQHPTTTGVAGKAKKTYKVYPIEDDGPIAMTSASGGLQMVAFESITVEGGEDIEISGSFDVEMVGGDIGDKSQFYAAYDNGSITGAGAAVLTKYNGAASEIKIPVIGTVENVSAGTHDFGVAVKFTGVPPAALANQVTITNLSVRITVLSL